MVSVGSGSTVACSRGSRWLYRWSAWWISQEGGRRTVQGVLPVTSVSLPLRVHSPGLYSLRAAQETIVRDIYDEEPGPDVRPEDLPSEPAGEVETPATYHQAHSGRYHRVWSAVERKEVLGLASVGTFVRVDPS